MVASETVLAHVRSATQGEKTVLNCHPFQYGRWVFAHNGDIPDFAKHREALFDEVAPNLRRYILGETDSEVVFFIFLVALVAGYGPLSRRHAVERRERRCARAPSSACERSAIRRIQRSARCSP